MGIDVDAMLIYGIPYKDLPEDILEEVDEMLDNAELDYANPWYDSEREYWIVGVKIPCYGKSYADLLFSISSDFEFPLVMQGLKLKFYVTPHES